MTIKSKVILNDSVEYVLKIIKEFDIKEPINPKHMTEIMEFYDDKKLIGIVNYLSYPVLDYEKIFIRSIYYKDSKYIDKMIKLFIKKMKVKYNAIYTNIIQPKYNKNIIDTLLKNDFYGDEYFFLRY